MKVLGISYSRDHDASCALVIDGKLIYAVSEERLTRIKQDGSFPINSIRSALDFAGMKPAEIDYVVIGWSHPYKQLITDLPMDLRSTLNPKSIFYTLIPRLHHLWIRGGFRRYQQYFGKSRFLFCPHHLAHAISAYCYSPFDDAAVVVVDGRGAFEASSIWHGNKGSVELVKMIEYPNSLGLFYAKFTKYLGFQPLSDEWKLMGLSSYGHEGIPLDKFITQENIYSVNSDLLEKSVIDDVSGIEEILGQSRKNGIITEFHKNVAYSVQKETEKSMLSLAGYALKETGSNKLCLAGGVALNCRANGLIANSGMIENIFVQPAASDEGAALGAALYPYLLYEKTLPKDILNDVYLGPGFDHEEIVGILDNSKIGYENIRDMPELIAGLLKEGKIIGLFQGRMEFGPRALGNRSIIANPGIPEMKDQVNNSVKYRENWRPFAPSILEDYYYEYMDAQVLSPFMTLSFPVKENVKRKIVSATHVDDTARPQSVSRLSNENYYNIIKRFGDRSGVPAVLNTSFNLKGEPVVCTPLDAIRTFYTSGLDCLVLEDLLITKD